MFDVFNEGVCKCHVAPLAVYFFEVLVCTAKTTAFLAVCNATL